MKKIIIGLILWILASLLIFSQWEKHTQIIQLVMPKNDKAEELKQEAIKLLKDKQEREEQRRREEQKKAEAIRLSEEIANEARRKEEADARNALAEARRLSEEKRIKEEKREDHEKESEINYKTYALKLLHYSWQTSLDDSRYNFGRNLKANVVITIDFYGRITQIQFDKRSDNYRFDRMVEESIRKTIFYKFPDDLDKRFVKLPCSFKLN